MAFRDLYSEVQAIKGKISVRVLRDLAIRFSAITKVKEQWSGAMDPAFMQGFYIEGPQGPPIPLAESEALITIARTVAKNKHRRRFVYAKELMHVFDSPEEKVDTPEKLEALAERFHDPTAGETPQYRSEEIAFWRALAVLGQEERRKAFKNDLEANTVTLEVVATALQIPPTYARLLFRDDFQAILQHIM
jgi:hypothetical protein